LILIKAKLIPDPAIPPPSVTIKHIRIPCKKCVYQELPEKYYIQFRKDMEDYGKHRDKILAQINNKPLL
jgi:hypothetical protein